MVKSADAFRTISEVSDWLETPAHVLRFWESRFTQVKPVKRAGGRRYYRPTDMQLLGGIRRLLHDDGITIKGVQKIMREKGVKYVGSLSLPLPGEDDDQLSVPETTPITEILENDGNLFVADDSDEAEDDFDAKVDLIADSEDADATEIAEPTPQVPDPTAEEIAAKAPDAKKYAAEIEDELDDRAFLERFIENEKPPGQTAAAPVRNGLGDTGSQENRVTVLYQRLLHLRNRMHRDMMQG